MDNNYSYADLAALSRENDGLFGGNGIIILILFFLMFGANGWGGNGNWGNGCGRSFATAEDVYTSANQQNVGNGIAGIREAICNSNMMNVQNTNAIQHTLNTGFDNVTAQLSNLGFQMAQCCCDLKTQMLTDRYEDTKLQLQQAQGVIANTAQSQYILGQLGRYVTNPSYPLLGTTVS